MSIKENIEKVKQTISQRREETIFQEEVILIAVTKTVEIERMKEAMEAGIYDFGENKVQEIQKKYDSFPEEIRWHLIGTLQSNKVKYIIDKVEMIHSLDRLSLAEEINKRAKEIGKTVKCLVQINISQEESKHGLSKEGALEFIGQIAKDYPHIQIMGLMGMAPFVEDKEEARRYFRQMRELFDEAKQLELGNGMMKYLSMGMTNDYPVAIEEGSNMVRVGTGIFGTRNYA